ncbi:hypothetical protein L596_015179 [Steinernema carpocapsae]|uniref:Alpha-mannosidase n=1 Tax=Steinernema carpocapsae TaxID=34508 RepID=A0A4U5NEE8_STECR|nr:hypothetical protein L596_015179 [Steinernema carpocapsae]
MNFPWRLIRRNAILFAVLGLFALVIVYDWKSRSIGLQTEKFSRSKFASPDGKPLPICSTKYGKEPHVDFNTRDLYAEVQAGISPRNHTTFQKVKTDKLKVFVIPMTHVDPGWLHTFDKYSEDTNNILNNMLEFVPKNPKMRFIWCEMIFLERWFRELPEEKKNAVRKLIKTGQLELASGSWVMTDEANPFLPITVDNIVEGQQFVFKEFGVRPSTIWSNDPFGYSNAVPYLFTKTGIHQAVINRIHHGIKNKLQSLRAIPFTWKQFFDITKNSDMLTQVLPYTHYDVLNSCGPNSGVCCQFDFRRITDWHCGGEGAQEITDSNVKTKSADLVGQFEEMSKMYQSNVLMMMLGDDFRYDGIREWHQQHDNYVKLFDHINAKGNVEVRFGTFSDYFTTLKKFNEEHKVEPVALSGDFFPYSCALGDDWTGYFTTRPFYKRKERMLHALVRAADLLSSQATPYFEARTLREVNEMLTVARRNLSLFQHHDAITGTSKISVMRNYGELLHNASIQSAAVLEASFKAISESTFELYEVPVAYNASARKKLIKLDKSKKTSLRVFNSLPQRKLETVAVRVNSPNVKVVDAEGNPVRAQLNPFMVDGKGVSKDSYLLVFLIQLPRLSAVQVQLVYEELPESTVISQIEFPDVQNVSFYVEREFPRKFKSKGVKRNAIALKTKRIATTHNEKTGLLESIKTSAVESTRLVQKMMMYKQSRGGPYLIRSDSGSIEEFADLGFVFTVKGPLQQSIHVLSKFYAVHYVARDTDDTEGEQLHVRTYTDIRTFQNSEAIARFAIDSKTFSLFTDNVGLHMIKRDYFPDLPVGKNYYPMPSSLFVQDDKKRITVVSNVEHGCSGQKNGFEIMLDRTMSIDDGKGLGMDDSLLVDLIPVEIDFTIILEQVQSQLPEHYAYNTINAHNALQTLMYRPLVFISSENNAKSSSLATNAPSFPCDIQLLTVRPMSVGEDASEKLMILYRPGVECSASTDSACSKQDLTESVRAYLQELKINKVAKTNLNGLVVEENFKPLNFVEFSVDSMDFASYRLKH